MFEKKAVKGTASRVVGNDPLRILMISRAPWNRELGASKVQLELADEFRKMGHVVEKFDFFDAYPEYRKLEDSGHRRCRKIAELVLPGFAVRARNFVIQHGENFDVIDAHDGALPYSKKELRYEGLLVVRSVGSFFFYQAFEKRFEKEYGSLEKRFSIFAFLRRKFPKKGESWNDNVKSYKEADLVNVCNSDEQKYVENTLRMKDKCIVHPFGLSEENVREFQSKASAIDARRKEQKVVFVGAWGPRKGSRDWPVIVRKIRERIPKAKFLFLGTAASEQEVLEELSVDSEGIEIVPYYKSEQLPELISDATVGAFPSYIEGFGIAVLEKICSGIPTVAYDVPGPRDILEPLKEELLINEGNVNAFSARLINLLEMDNAEYVALSERCSKRALDYAWLDIAWATLHNYEERLRRIFPH